MTFAGLPGEWRTGAVRLEGRHGEVTFFVVRFLLPSLGVFSGSARDLGAVSSSVRCRLPDTSDGTGIVHALSTRVCSLTLLTVGWNLVLYNLYYLASGVLFYPACYLFSFRRR